MSFQHRQLAAGRWNTLTLVEQLANIGSEVERTLRWREKGNEEYAMRAMERALELFALSLACPANKGRLKEIARAKEVFLDFVCGDNEFNSSADSLRRYFHPFAYAARLARDRQLKEKLSPQK